MNVLIKGMEMPTTGLYIVSIDNTNGRNKTVATVERMLCIRDIRQIVGAFELIPVPAHGRLIDADAFCEKVLEIVERQKYDDFYAKSLSVGAILREMVRELRGEGFDGFDNAPTIIPAEPEKEKET